MENYKSCIHSDYSIFSACNPDWHTPLTSLYANPAAEKFFWGSKMQQIESLLLLYVLQKKTRLIIFKWIS